MLDDYKDTQTIAYAILKNSIENNRISHAYLIDSNNSEDTYDFIFSFIKTIICKNHYSNHEKCDNCNLCNRIDNGNYSEVKVIEAEGNVIKKEQLLELQSEFSRTSIEGNYRIYVIKDCDKMNKQSANSILKFLEEPVSGIIAILVTNNVNKLLDTIISRCQLIKLSNNKKFLSDDILENFSNYCCFSKEEIDSFFNDDLKLKLIEDIRNIIVYYENNGLDIMIYLKKMWYNNFLTRDDSYLALLLMVNFYYDVLKYKFELEDYFFTIYIDDIKNVAIDNSVEKIIDKINICIEKADLIKSNLNVNLMIDDLFIRFGDVDEYSRS